MSEKMDEKIAIETLQLLKDLLDKTYQSPKNNSCK